MYINLIKKISWKISIILTAKKEVSLTDFGAFFAPDGILNTFYNDQLDLFLNENVFTDDAESGNNSIVNQAYLMMNWLKQRKYRKHFLTEKAFWILSFHYNR